jgi:hypothetical protein
MKFFTVPVKDIAIKEKLGSASKRDLSKDSA